MSELAPITDGVARGDLFAVVDNIWVMLAIVVISALSSWFQKRNQKGGQAEPWGGEDDENYHPQRPGGPAPAPNRNQPLNWEEELKRLLEGQPPLDSTAGTPPPPPPPIVRRAEPPPLPASVARESQGVDEESRPARESTSPWQGTTYDSLPAPTKPLAHLQQNTQAYQRATQLHETIAAHLRRVDEQTEKHGQPLHAPTPAPRAINPEARAVVALLRRPGTARQALLASFVLAPPKALES
ncbi:MAG: hypothetical protein ACKODH_18035 [Limisphaerales bacterium]